MSLPSRTTTPLSGGLPNVSPSGMVNAARQGDGGWMAFLRQLVPGIGSALQNMPGEEQGQSPFQPVPLLDTMAPAPQMGGGGTSMAAIQQALQMLAQLMQQQQGPPGGDPMASMMGGTGPGY